LSHPPPSTRVAFSAVVAIAAACSPPPPAQSTSSLPPVARVAAAASAPAPPAAADDVLEETVATPDLTFVFRASPIANLAYELDCLADVVPCSGPAYRELWSGALALDDADQAAIKEWRATRKRYDAGPQEDPGAMPSGGESSPTVPPPETGFDLGQHVRVAACVARSKEDYARLEGLLVRPADAAELAAILERFLPRFTGYWRGTARAEAAAFHAGLVQLFREGPLAKTIGDVARFYAPELPRGSEIEFDLMVRPKSTHTTTRAEQIASHAVVEFLPGEAPSERVDVVSHELFHFFYDARAASSQRALARHVAGADDALAAVAYELLDESTATAFGNGLVAERVAPERYARRLAKERGFYNDRAIDRVSKAMLPRLRDMLAAGKTIDSPDFATALVAAAHESLDRDLAPADYLHSLTAGASEGFEDALSAFQSAASVNYSSVYSPVAAPRVLEDLRAYPDLSGMVLVAAKDAGDLAKYGDLLPAGAAARIAALAARGSPFVYTVPRSKKAYLFVLVAKDLVGVAALAESLAHATKITPGAAASPMP
jgi:hypothetical protein